MKHFLHLTDFTPNEIHEIFAIADELQAGKYNGFLNGKTVAMFLPQKSLCTRITFEKGINLLGGQAVLYPPESFYNKESLFEVAGYLNNWADIVIVRHKNIEVLETLSKYLTVPIINAMTDVNHPCEIISDLYVLSKRREDFTKDKYLFCGVKGNIGLAWKEAADVLNLDLSQCCPEGFEIEGVTSFHNIKDAVVGKDIICTDSLPSGVADEFQKCQVTKEALSFANEGAVLNPCPLFNCGQEVSSDAIDSKYFVGYEFKKRMLEVEQAIIIFCLTR